MEKLPYILPNILLLNFVKIATMLTRARNGRYIIAPLDPLEKQASKQIIKSKIHLGISVHGVVKQRYRLSITSIFYLCNRVIYTYGGQFQFVFSFQPVEILNTSCSFLSYTLDS